MEAYEIPTGSEAVLIGELIGLARGTDGSEHLITPEITNVVSACLRAKGGDALMEDLRQLAISAKRKVVPNCFTCANPCGRTFPFDLNLLDEEPESIRQKKLALLEAARELAGAQRRTQQQDGLLYRALIAIGIQEIDPEALSNLLDAVRGE